MRELPSAEQKHLSQVAQAQLISDSPQDDLKDDVSWHLEEVEQSAGPLVELTLTTMAVIDVISEIGRFVKASGIRRAAVGAVHPV
jgi:hypothetical protein